MKENTLILVDYQSQKLNSLKASLSPLCQEIICLEGNLADTDFVNLVNEKMNLFDIDILINNAAIAHGMDRVENIDQSEYLKSWEVNFHTPFRLISSAISKLRSKGKGIILNISSRASSYGYLNMGVYAATKAALNSLSNTVALENPEIKSIAVIVGRTNTPMQEKLRGLTEATNSQSPTFVAETIGKLIYGEINIENGDYLIIDSGEYKVVRDLLHDDLHKNMHHIN
jgi:short-subunit dehydrogenase